MNTLKHTGIDSRILKPSLTFFEEQWCPNGNGHLLLNFNYSATNDTIRPFSHRMNCLPRRESVWIPGEGHFNHGFYLLDWNERDYYRLFRIDTPEKGEGI